MPVPEGRCRFATSDAGSGPADRRPDSILLLYCFDWRLGSARVGRAAAEARVCTARRAAEAADPVARVRTAGVTLRVARLGALGRTWGALEVARVGVVLTDGCDWRVAVGRAALDSVGRTRACRTRSRIVAGAEFASVALERWSCRASGLLKELRVLRVPNDLDASSMTRVMVAPVAGAFPADLPVTSDVPPLPKSLSFVRPRSGASGTKPRPPDPMMPDGSAGTVVGILIVGAPDVGLPPNGPGPSNVPLRGPAAIGPGSWIPEPDVPSQPLPPPRTMNGPGPDPPPRAMPPMIPISGPRPPPIPLSGP